jgi:hypothetical protein
MARRVNEILWDQWRQRIARQRASGLSITAFCREEQVAPHSFHVWKRKLGGAASKAAPAQPTGRQSAAVASRRRACRPPVRAAERVRSAEFLQLPVAPVRSSPWIELTLPEGTVMRLPQQNLAALVTVLRVLRDEPVPSPQAEHRHA